MFTKPQCFENCCSYECDLLSVKFFALATYTHTTHPLQAANSFFVGLSPHILTHFQVRFTIKLGKSKPFKVQEFM